MSFVKDMFREFGFDGRTVENKGKLILTKIQYMFITQIKVKIGNYLSCNFPIDNGLKQGDDLLLYLLFFCRICR